ncbi:Unknown protein sequence [Pseudomonas amygdali pv. myricae]|nr:Unknown protein sequence [Pseudomonas amygdali pv. myricae]
MSDAAVKLPDSMTWQKIRMSSKGFMCRGLSERWVLFDRA